MLIGRKLGKYEITDMLGQGGMATVYRGYQEEMERFVAVKVLPPHPGLEASFVERFKLEARVVARLQHPHILPVYDYGTEDDILYFVMAYVEGGSLSDLIKQGPLTLRQTEKILREVASALDYAHRQGYMHRDIKPANILMDNEGHALLADFGIARLVEQGSGLTGTGVVGTPAYMAPEQAKGLEVDQRADIYALGVVVYEMLTGQQPYHADTAMLLLLKHINDPVPSLLGFKDVPAKLNEVVERVLAKEPEDRYQSAVAFAQDFSAAVASIEKASDVKLSPAGNVVTRVLPGTPAAPTRSPAPTQAAQPTEVQTMIVQHPATNPIVLIGALGLVALVIVIVAGLFFTNLNNNAPAPTATITAPVFTAVPSFGRLNFLTTTSLGDTVSLSVQGLSAAGSGRVYAVWLVNNDSGATMLLGRLNLDPLGSGTLTFSDTQRRMLAANFNTVIITAESEIGGQPAGEILYSGHVPPAVSQAITEIFVASDNGLRPGSAGGMSDYQVTAITNSGLLTGALAEGSIAEQHTGLAAHATTLGGVRVHAEHTINILRGTRDDLDGNGRGENPGRGVGVYAFLDWIEEQLDSAVNAPGVSLYVQSQVELVRVCLDNARGWADEVIALETAFLAAADFESITPQLAESTATAGRMMRGQDLNGNGQIEPFEGECGLEQINEYAVLLGSLDIVAGAPASGGPDSGE